jgi:5,10-methylenetetrahydromethanopterin reductase
VLVADEGTDRDLFVTLAAIAQATRRVLLIGAVTNPHTRHPVASAAAFATLAELAPGRVVAGFGAGGSRVLAPMGLKPARPYTALAECLDVVESLLRGNTVEHYGEFAVRGVSLPWSAERRVPIALAGRGPRVERLAAERADYMLLAGRNVRTIPELVPRLRALGVAARGRAPRIVWNPVAAWTPSMREELRAHLVYMAVDMPAAERSQLGLDAERTAELRAIVNSRGPAAAACLIADDVLEQYAIVGNRSQVLRRLADLCREVRPDILVFDLAEYSVAYLESLASLAMDAGAAVFHNLDALEM